MTDHWKDVGSSAWVESAAKGAIRVYSADFVDAARAKDAEAHARTLAEYDAVLKQRGYEIAEERGLRLSCEDMARMEIERLKADHAAAMAAKDAEIGSYKHEHALLEADTMRGITDCSTPIFQRVRNIVEQLEAAESERDTLRAQRQQVTTERNAADARLAEVEAERDESEAQVESLRAQLDQQAQRYNAALDRLIADKDQLSLAGSHLRAQLAAVQSATPEAVTRELERGHYSIIRAWLALHGGTSAQIAVEEMAQLVRSFGEPLTLKEPKA